MSWPVLEIDSWSKFAGLAGMLTNRNPQEGPAYLFRGQADVAWPLQPSLLRLFRPTPSASHVLAVEKFALDEFSSQAHLHLPASTLPDGFPKPSLPEWWALMQHYRAPTRLLDWTHSPYVAAYYAVEDRPEAPGVILGVHAATASSSFKAHYPSGEVKNEQMENPTAPEGLLFWTPKKRTDRLVAQQGMFSLSPNVIGRQEDIIAEACAKAGEAMPGKLWHVKWTIAPTLKREFLGNLRAMNIAAHTLFPGADGLGRSISETTRLAADCPKARGDESAKVEAREAKE